MNIKLEPLTREAFAPYGEVIEGIGEFIDINAGTCQRYEDLSRINIEDPARSGISYFRAKPRDLPLNLELFERHPFGSQAFLPHGNKSFCVVVTEGTDDDAPDLQKIRAFIAINQGINFKRNVWHHPLIALEDVSTFWVVDHVAIEDNLDARSLEIDITIEN